MPAKDKMREPRYYDSTSDELPTAHFGNGSSLKALAGNWHVEQQPLSAPLQDLAATSSIADLSLTAGDSLVLDCDEGEQLAIFCYDGELHNLPGGFVAKTAARVELKAIKNSTVLLFRGIPIREKIVHMGPFVMNSEAEIRQAIDDYRSGRIGILSI
jgi:redox-sensitive bicupin YhaK (pirin superfamily)